MPTTNWDGNIIEMTAIKVKFPGNQTALIDISTPEGDNGIIRVAGD